MILIIATMVPIITEAEINKTGTYFSVIPERNIVESNCTEFTVDINITNAPETYAWEVYLGFDDSVLNFVNAKQGPWLASFAPYGELNTTFAYLNKTGYVGISCLFKGPISPGASGNGRLCNVTFHVEDDTGFTKLNLYDTSLVDMDGVKSYYPNNDGFFEGASVTALHDVAITKITVNGSETYLHAQQNDTVEIIVDILNEGDEDQNVGIEVYAERLTHNPADKDEVWVGDLGSMDRASGDPNWRSRPEYKIGENTSVFVASAGGTNSSRFIWDTRNVAGEIYKICAVLVKTGDNDPDDNVFVGPEVQVVSGHDLKILDVNVLTPEVDKSNGITGAKPAQTRIIMNFTGLAGANITSIEACDWFNVTSMHQRVGLNEWAPRPSTWWEVLGVGVQFHVDKSFPGNHTFHIDRVLPAEIPETGINQAWLMAEQVGKIEVTVKNEGKVQETADVYVFAEDPLIVMNFSWLSGPGDPMLEPCNLYTNNTKVFPMPCSWWHIIWPEELYCKEFHVSDIDWDPSAGTFHIDFVWPDNETITTPFILAKLEHIVDVQPVTLEPWTNATHRAKTLYFTWNVTGDYIADPTQILPGEYTISALVMPVDGEEGKNWGDNKFIDGTIKVLVFDVAVVKVEILQICNIAGFNPVLRIRATLRNLGSELVKVNVAFIATTDFADPTNVSSWIVFGQSIGVSTIPGEYTVIDTMSPFGGWCHKFPSLAYTDLSPEPGTAYLILASASPYIGRDNNPTNDANAAGPWTLPADLDTYSVRDVQGFAGWLGTEKPAPSVRDVKPIELRAGVPEVFYTNPLIIDVNVLSYAEYPLFSESVDVDLFYRNDTAKMIFNQQGASITEIKNCTSYTRIAGLYPDEDSWWHIVAPDELYSIEFHVDQVDGGLFHIDKVMVSGNVTDVILAASVQNATAEKEVQIGTTQTISGVPAMQIMAFFNETFPTDPTAEIKEIKSCKWYVYNMTWGGETYGNLLYGPSIGWFELKLPVYGFMVHIDQVQPVSNATHSWYKIHFDMVGYYDVARKRFVARNATGYPLPQPLQLAWRLQPKTATFELGTGPGTPFPDPDTWYSLELVAHLTLTTATDVDPCDNKITGYSIFKIRCPWGDVNDDGWVSGSDIVKLIKIIGGDIPKPYVDPRTWAQLVPDVRPDGFANAKDIVKVILIINKSLPQPCP